MAPKVHTKRCHGCTGPGTKEALGEEVAPWNTSTVGNLPLLVDNRTVHPQGSLSLVNKNKIHALHVEDIEDTLYQI